MTRLRARVAERLKGAQNTFAMLTTFNEVDMTNLMKLRTDFKVPACIPYPHPVKHRALRLSFLLLLSRVPEAEASVPSGDW